MRDVSVSHPKSTCFHNYRNSNLVKTRTMNMATFYASTVNKNKEATHQQVSELARLNEYFKAEDLC